MQYITEAIYSIAIGIVCHLIMRTRRESFLPKFTKAIPSLGEGKVENDRFCHCIKMTEFE